jgi:hypothetical protein
MHLIVYKITKGRFKYGQQILHRSDIHGHDTRGAWNINLPYFRMAMGRNSFKYEVFNIFNELPISIRDTNSYSSFTIFVKTRLYDGYMNSGTP